MLSVNKEGVLKWVITEKGRWESNYQVDHPVLISRSSANDIVSQPVTSQGTTFGVKQTRNGLMYLQRHLRQTDDIVLCLFKDKKDQEAGYTVASYFLVFTEKVDFFCQNLTWEHGPCGPGKGMQGTNLLFTMCFGQNRSDGGKICRCLVSSHIMTPSEVRIFMMS